MGLAGNGRCCCCPRAISELRHFSRRELNPASSACAALYRSNKHLHHRLPKRIAAHGNRKGTLGNRRYRFSVISTRSLPCGQPEPATHGPSRGPFHGTKDQRRDSNPLFPGAKYPSIFTTSVHWAAFCGKSFQGNGRGRIGQTATVS